MLLCRDVEDRAEGMQQRVAAGVEEAGRVEEVKRPAMAWKVFLFRAEGGGRILNNFSEIPHAPFDTAAGASASYEGSTGVNMHGVEVMPGWRCPRARCAPRATGEAVGLGNWHGPDYLSLGPKGLPGYHPITVIGEFNIEALGTKEPFDARCAYLPSLAQPRWLQADNIRRELAGRSKVPNVR